MHHKVTSADRAIFFFFICLQKSSQRSLKLLPKSFSHWSFCWTDNIRLSIFMFIYLCLSCMHASKQPGIRSNVVAVVSFKSVVLANTMLNYWKIALAPNLDGNLKQVVFMLSYNFSLMTILSDYATFHHKGFLLRTGQNQVRDWLLLSRQPMSELFRINELSLKNVLDYFTVSWLY